MPIVDPAGLAAPDLFPLRIQAHCLDAPEPGHQGETHDQRIAGYLRQHPQSAVPGLPQGIWVDVRGGACRLCGPHPAQWFRRATATGILPGGPLALG